MSEKMNVDKTEVAGENGVGGGDETSQLRRELARYRFEVARLREQALEQQRVIEAMRASTSWRITAPMRVIALLPRHARMLLQLLAHLVRRHGGGLWGVVRLAAVGMRLLFRHGPRQWLLGARHYAAELRADDGGVGEETVDPQRRERPGWRDRSLVRHQATVDVVVCVHNALEDVRRCLSSVVRYTLPPYRIIVVDDGSAEETMRYLEAFCAAQGSLRIRNDQARGYTFAANMGMRAADGDYVVLLNSDTIVGPEWVDRMVMAAESAPRIGIVGPLSNTASWQSVPRILVDGDWAENPLPEGVSYCEMSERVAAEAARIYPRLPFLNGFCMMIKRALIDDIGLFDEEAFGAGYGEENDYCLRAGAAGWALAVADDVYVHHAQSKSYSHERRKKLADRAGRILAQKHGDEAIQAGVMHCRYDPAMEGIRARAEQMWARHALRGDGMRRWEGRRIAIVLPVAEAGGGANVVIQEARALAAMGIDVRLVNLEVCRQSFSVAYPELDIPVLFAPSQEAVAGVCEGFDAVVATTYASVFWLESLAGRENGPRLGYYIQDFEPYFWPEDSGEYRIAWDSYGAYPGQYRFTKTEWNRRELKERIGIEATVIGASCDTELFQPFPGRAQAQPGRPVRVAAMIRPSTPRRAPLRTMEVLAALVQRLGGRIEVVLFGVDEEDPAFLALPVDFAWRCVGIQTSAGLAQLFNEVDVFVDYSEFQAMGLTALEAMACGCAVVVPQRGGADSFARSGENALVVDTASVEAMIEATERLVRDDELRVRLGREAIHAAAAYHPDGPAWNIAHLLFGEGNEGEK
ncbi:glycosyltransferase [Endothiovibrio diazotrophicus]